MNIEFDGAKNEANLAKHGISLERAVDFEMRSVVEDNRHDYGETRYLSWGLIDGEYYCLVFTPRDNAVRAISLRRAHEKEIRRNVP